jgi:hypothetical protein
MRMCIKKTCNFNGVGGQTIPYDSIDTHKKILCNAISGRLMPTEGALNVRLHAIHPVFMRPYKPNTTRSPVFPLTQRDL